MARRALSHLLTHLRHALSSPEIVLTRDDQVELNREYVWTDTTACEQLSGASIPCRQLPSYSRASI